MAPCRRAVNRARPCRTGPPALGLDGWHRGSARLPTSEPSNPAASAATAPAAAGWPDLAWPLVICGYFALQVVWRRLLGAGLNLDEAEILLWSRHLALGYGPQPPLYSWLQWAFLEVIPDRLLALSLLKNLLLAATYLAVWRLLRSAYPDRIAGPAALALFLVPQISWDSQRDLTHSVLATALAAAAALVFWTRALPGRRGGWALLGLLTGLGLLAKANFLVVPAAFVLAAVSLAELRARISLRGLLVATAVTVAVVAVPLAWAIEHPELAFASTHKLAMATRPGPAAAATGLADLAVALVDLLLVTVIVVGGIGFLRRREAMAAAPAGPLDRLLFRALAIGLALATAGVLASGATNVRSLWLLPLVYLAAPLAAIHLLQRTGAAGARALVRTIGVLALLVFVALGVAIRYGEPGNPALYRAPVAEAAADLVARFPDAERIVAEPDWLAGALVYHRPDLPVVSADDPGAAPPPGARVVAIWWDGDWRDRITTGLARAWGGRVALGAPETTSRAFPLQPDEPFETDAAEVMR